MQKQELAPVLFFHMTNGTLHKAIDKVTKDGTPYQMIDLAEIEPTPSNFANDYEYIRQCENFMRYELKKV